MGDPVSSRSNSETVSQSTEGAHGTGNRLGLRAGEPPPPWIAWEYHRRSRELARALGADFFPLLSPLPYPLRIALLSLRTFVLLVRRRPRLLFIQNPSLMLALLACLLRPLFRYRLVVDRHSNFIMRTRKVPRPVESVVMMISRFTNRHADLTIVTNEELLDLVHAWGGKGFILQDRLPDLRSAVPRDLGPGRHVCFISTYGPDEPIVAVAEAARLLPRDVTIHVTGRLAAAPHWLRDDCPANVRLTDFLPEEDYLSLLASCDVVMALTTRPATLLCGAYESVSLHKPTILSDQQVLRSYFHRGIVFTENTGRGIAAAILDAVSRREELTAEVADLARELRQEWEKRFDGLLGEIGSLLQ